MDNITIVWNKTAPKCNLSTEITNILSFNVDEHLIFLQWDSSCAAYFMIAVTFTSHPPPRSSQADKMALSLPISPALYSHDTSSLFVIRLSLSNSISSLTATGAVIYMQILIWFAKKKGKKNCFSSYHKINIAHNLVSFPLLYPIVFPWLDMASRESSTCCLQSRVKCWRGQGAQRGSWWERGQGWILAGRRIRKQLQGKINTNKVQVRLVW